MQSDKHPDQAIKEQSCAGAIIDAATEAANSQSCCASAGNPQSTRIELQNYHEVYTASI